MTFTLRVVGWRDKHEVAEPITFVRVLQRVSGQPLATAKSNLDAFAKYGEVLIDFDDELTRDAVARELSTLGAWCIPMPAVGALLTSGSGDPTREVSGATRPGSTRGTTATRQPTSDVIARVRLHTTEEGGRKKPIRPGWFACPFVYGGEAFDCRLLLDEASTGIRPGDTAEVRITFLNPELVKPRLSPGSLFKLWEGGEFADGEVLSVVT